MNIEIHVRKDHLHSDPEITVQFGEVRLSEKISSVEQKISLKNIKHDCDATLSIERNEPGLYTTNQNYHDNKIFVDKVIVDDFWEFDNMFYPPTTTFTKEYEEHLDKVGFDDWIKQSMTYNTHLFFNGSLVWNVKYPGRRSFFKDVAR